jgi:putative membrane protein
MTEDDKHGGLRGTVDKLQDKLGSMMGMASAGTAGSSAADAFVANAGVGSLYGIEASRIALQRSRSEPVRAFAQMMIEDHTTALHQLASALRTNEVREDHPSLELPTELDARRSTMVDHLRKAPDADFDERYVDQQRSAHAETLTLLRGYAQIGDNPQLRSVARSAIPMAERHQATAGRI